MLLEYISMHQSVRLFWYFKYFSFYAFICDEDQQIVYSPSSKYIFSSANRNIEKASHIFEVYRLLIDTVQFVWLCVETQKLVIQ